MDDKYELVCRSPINAEDAIGEEGAAELAKLTRSQLKLIRQLIEVSKRQAEISVARRLKAMSHTDRKTWIDTWAESE